MQPPDAAGIFDDTAAFRDENKDFTPISRFGIGILTCFMISDDIEVLTTKNGKAYRLRMTSAQASYLLKMAASDVPYLGAHGTRVKNYCYEHQFISLNAPYATSCAIG